MRTFLLLQALLLTFLSSAAGTTRFLQEDPNTNPDPDAFQELVSQLVLQLPDFEIVETILVSDLVVHATNVQCTQVVVGDLQVTSTINDKNNDQLTLQADLSQLDVVCTLEYNFNYKLFLFPVSGSGSLRMVLKDNTASAAFSFVAADSNNKQDARTFDTHPPSNVTLDTCNALFTIDDMEFYQSEGGSLGSNVELLNSMEGLIRGFIEDDIGTTLCDEMGTELEWVAQDMVQAAYELLESYLEEMEVPPSNPLVVPEGVTLINYTSNTQPDTDLWTQLTDPEQPWLTTLLTQVNTQLKLGEPEMDDNTNQEDLRINLLMRDYLLEDDAGLVLDVDRLQSFVPDFDPILLQDDNNAFAVTLQSLSIYGLDSFRQLQLLEATAANPYTLNNQLQLDYLRIEANVALQFNSNLGDDSMILDPNGALAALEENLTLTFQLDDIELNASLLLAMDQTAFHQLGMGAMLQDFDILLDCLLSSVFQSELTTLQLQVGNLQEPTLTGDFLSKSPMLDNAVTNLVEAGMIMYENAILRAIPNVVQTQLQALLNDSVFSGDASSQATCSPLPPTGNPWLDFRDLFLDEPESSALGGSGTQPYGSLVPMIVTFAKELLETNPSSVASFLLGGEQEGNDLYFPGQVAGDSLRIWLGSLDATIAYGVSDIRIENLLDSIGQPVTLLDPVQGEASLLNNEASVGVGQPLKMSARVMLSVDSDVETMRNEFVIGADVQNLATALLALLSVLEDRYSSFPIRDLFNLDCWIAMIPAPVLDEFGLREGGAEPTAAVRALSVVAQQLNANMECLECSSPGLLQLEQLWSTPSFARDFTEVGNDLLDYSTGIALEFLQIEIDRKLNEAALRCPHSPLYDAQFTEFSFQEIKVELTQDESSSVAVLLVVVIACGIVFFGAIYFLLRWLVQRRHSKWLRTLPNEKLAILAKRQQEEDEKETELNHASSSMFQSSNEIPSFVRYIIPLVIIGNIALFLSGHFNVAAEVSIVASFAGQQFEVNDVYAFSMARSAVEIWNAGGYILSLGILVFAGIWPYTRQILFLALWFLTPAKCSISRRGSILHWLDALAKWSIVDIFTVIITVVAFRLSIQSPATAILPENFYSVDLLVTPKWGLYANLLAQVISQISSHIIIHYHRNILHEATKSYRQKHGILPSATSDANESVQSWDPYGEQKDTLCKQQFSRPHKAEAEKLVARCYVNYAVVIGAVAICFCIIIGCIIPSVGLEFFGLLGVAVELGQDGEAAMRELSTFGLVGMIMEQAAYLDSGGSYLGLGFLCGVLVITVLLVPLMQSALLLYHWFVPMAGKKRKRVSIALEYLQAWQYAEVYIISVIVASWQLGGISAHLFNEYCEDMVDTLNMFASFGVIGENDTQCFRTNASIMGGCYMMAAGALLLALLNSYVNSASQQYIRSRDEEIDHETQCDDWKEQEVLSSPVTVKMSYDFEDVSSVGIDGDKATASPEEDGSNLPGGEREKSSADYYDTIRPITRVQFTDKFRWTLCGDTGTTTR